MLRRLGPWAGRRLADCGLLTRRAAGSLDTAARRTRDLALRMLPPRVAQQIFRRLRSSAARLESAARFGGVEWSRSAAFSEEVNTQPGVWINLAGREAAGSVARADYERARRNVIDALLDWKLDGTASDERVVARALPREEVYDGPFAARAPDVVLELGHERGYLHSLVATPWDRAATGALHTLADDEVAGGRGRGMNGTHRCNGIWLASEATAERPASIAHVAVVVLRALGVETDAAGDGGNRGHPRTKVPYSAKEEALVAARLRALGYLE